MKSTSSSSESELCNLCKFSNLTCMWFTIHYLCGACLECTTEGTEKGRSHPEDGKEIATFKNTIAPFASESVSPPPGSDDETTKEDQKYLRKPGKQRKWKQTQRDLLLGINTLICSWQRPSPSSTSGRQLLSCSSWANRKTITEMDQLCQLQRPGIENVPITGNRNMMMKLSFHQTTSCLIIAANTVSAVWYVYWSHFSYWSRCFTSLIIYLAY